MRRTLALSALALCSAAALVSCERVDANTSTGSNQITIDGSSTVQLLTEAVATDIRDEHPDLRPTISVSGTGGGFKRFVRGDTDISNASRPIKASELDATAAHNMEFIELPVALDGITFAVHPDNDWVDHFTVDELRAVFSRDGGVQKWSDIRPGWPEHKINLWTPGLDSGTYDFFVDVVFPDKAPLRNDLNLSESDHTLVRGLVDDPHAMGYFGFAYYTNNQGTLRSVPIINSAGDGVRPSLETIAQGAYEPFSRPLYIYVNSESAERESVQTFVDYYLDNAGRLAPVIGYAPLRDDQYQMVKELWGSRTTGTVWLKDDGSHVHGVIDEVYGR